MDKYTIYCTEAQTRKALELGASIKIEEDKFCSVAINPTSEQMIGWLEEKGAKCFVLQDMYDDDAYNIKINENLISTGHPQYDYPIPYDTRKDATLAVIDAALKYLIDNDLTK